MGRMSIRRIDRDTIVIELPNDFVTASTCLKGGFRKVNNIVVKHVPRDFDRRDLDTWCREVLAELGIEDAMIMATAVDLDEAVYLENKVGDVEIELFATIGFAPAVCIDIERIYEPLIGTINIVVSVDTKLTPNALLDLLRVIAEVKAISVSETLLRCKTRCCGTVTDCIAVAAPLDSRGYLFAGLATSIGNAVGRMVREAIRISFNKFFDIGKLVREVLGLSIERIAEIATELYFEAPLCISDKHEIFRKLIEIIRRFLEDPNTWCFLVAAREVDLHGFAGFIPHLSREEFVSDSHRIVADELLAIALANYLAGSKALLALPWVEKRKRRYTDWSSLPPFEDDIVSAIIASALSILYTELDRICKHGDR